MQRKRQLDTPDDGQEQLPVSKRARLTASYENVSDLNLEDKPAFAGTDHFTSLSDELLVRILSFLPTLNLLVIASVCRRFYRLSSDSQLWRTLYYHRFVLPRALRIPGFRHGSAREGRLHYSTRRTVWADGGWGRRGGSGESINWKRQYKVRHNWARGKATVEEVKVGETPFSRSSTKKTLAKVVEGIAVTADGISGLRAWDLKTREPIAQIEFSDGPIESTPTCLAIDDQAFEIKMLDVSVGFLDGSFGVWRLHLEKGNFLRRYRHEKSSNGQLVGIAYRHPFVLTATGSMLISLYNFDRPSLAGLAAAEHREKNAVFLDGSETDAGCSDRAALEELESQLEDGSCWGAGSSKSKKKSRSPNEVTLPAPTLLTSLKSHTSRAPLALSIRQMASFFLASVAYSFCTQEGWSIGIQDLQIRAQGASASSSPEVMSTRLAFTATVASSSLSGGSRTMHPSSAYISGGPTTLCYNHPYLLAALSDNTLILYVCTTTATKLSLSPGIRLWGHTSGISDAEITARGKAVSVSCRGEEIRVWELEGRVSGKSIQIRPNSNSGAAAQKTDNGRAEVIADQWDDRRNWVGFDDEMVIVLKETQDGRESLLVYDFS